MNIERIAVQGGIFLMGCTLEQGGDCETNEKPSHKVSVDDFYIGKYEVTQAQWNAMMGENPSHFKGDNFPVENISWNDVQEFIQKLNSQTGEKYRLPTEAEWEYAARGGNRSVGYKYSGSSEVKNVAWYSSESGYIAHAVGGKSPNELGVYDMSGNVWEWCNDRLGSYNGRTQTNPRGPLIGSGRVCRGGSRGKLEKDVRVSRRIGYEADYHDAFLGFRLACSSK
jgi:formylglycine-generating enzyme required for sulfatase activity